MKLTIPRIDARLSMLLTVVTLVVLAALFPEVAGTLAAVGFIPLAAGAILDERTEFADATALSTAGTGRQLVGDVIPLSVARDVGNGIPPIYLVIKTVVAFTSGGAATAQFELVSDAQAAIAVDGTATEHFVTQVFALAQLGANTVLAVIPLPSEPPNYETFLGIIANIGTAALTAGSIDAYLTLNPPVVKSYPDAI